MQSSKEHRNNKEDIYQAAKKKKVLINGKIVTVYLFEIKIYKVRQKSFKDFTIIDVITEAKYTMRSAGRGGKIVI